MTELLIINGVLLGCITDEETVYVPDGVEVVNNHSFAECKTVRVVVLPEGVTHIKEYAFAECPSLETVALPTTLQRIDAFALSGCPNLRTIRLPEGLREIGTSALDGCNNLRELFIDCPLQLVSERVLGHTIPDSITVSESCNELCTTEDYFFPNCRRVTFMGELLYIGVSVFDKCPDLERIDVPNIREVIPNYEGGSYVPFSRCRKLVLEKDIAHVTSIISFALRRNLDTNYVISLCAGFLKAILRDNTYGQHRRQMLGIALRHANLNVSQKKIGAKTFKDMLRLIIITHTGFGTIDEAQRILDSDIFQNDVEVLSVLYSQKAAAGDGGTEEMRI